MHDTITIKQGKNSQGDLLFFIKQSDHALIYL